jgi:prevent-host-death family protein
MKTATADQIRADLDTYLKATVRGPVVVTRNDRPVAVLLSLTDSEEVERIAMSHSRKLRRILQRSERQIAKGKGIPEDEFWRQMAEIRSPRRRKSPPK